MGKARRTYDVPDKGILWGWEVSAYVLTKAISAGAFLVLFLGWILGTKDASTAEMSWWTLGVSLIFLTLTGLLLIKDLDRPDRFLYVLLRPQWDSWLTKGGYAITIFGGLLTLWGVSLWFGWHGLEKIIAYGTAIFALITAVYTAFLFAQAKGRDFWQSPTLAIHMFVHSFMAGAAVFMIIGMIVENSVEWMELLRTVLITGIAINLFTIAIELITTHPTEEAKRTVDMILKGRYKNTFWGGVIVFGNLIPLAILAFAGINTLTLAIAGLIVLIGIYFTEKIWVEAPQRIPLS
jgi:formate-dependent nitrite reductase membrane component NrfD